MKFADYLDETGQAPYAFFTEHELKKDVVYKGYKGMPVNYSSAKAISEATGRKVSITEIME